jgi:hypothetical protein
MQSLASIIIVMATSVFVFLCFLIFDDIPFFWLLLLLVAVMIYGFFLNYDVRTMVISRDFRSDQACTITSRKTLSLAQSESGLNPCSLSADSVSLSVEFSPDNTLNLTLMLFLLVDCLHSYSASQLEIYCRL